MILKKGCGKMYPRLIVDMTKLRSNIDAVAEIAKERGNCSLMIVTKALCADERAVKMIAEHPAVDYIADSRVQNIMKNHEAIKKNSKQSVLLRLPMASEIENVVKYVDISFNSELSTVRMLNEEAGKQGKVHKVVLMIDVGDLREGIFFKNEDEIISVAQEINEMENVELFGIGVNLTCYGAIIPKYDNLQTLCEMGRKIEQATGCKLSMVSGGNSSSIYLVEKGELPEGINNLRLGEAFLLGNDTAYGTSLPGTVDDALILEAQIIELKEKPSLPIGEVGVDAFGQKPYYEDRGIIKRAILAIGQQDMDRDSMYPVDRQIDVLGASSDHMLLDVSKTEHAYKVGDIVSFRLGYGSVLKTSTSSYVEKVYK